MMYYILSSPWTLKDELETLPSFDHWMKKDVIVTLELAFWLPKLKRRFVDFWISFFLKEIWKKNFNMFFLMLDPKFKSLCLISSFIGYEQNKAIVEKYDKQFIKDTKNHKIKG